MVPTIPTTELTYTYLYIYISLYIYMCTYGYICICIRLFSCMRIVYLFFVHICIRNPWPWGLLLAAAHMGPLGATSGAG